MGSSGFRIRLFILILVTANLNNSDGFLLHLKFLESAMNALSSSFSSRSSRAATNIFNETEMPLLTTTVPSRNQVKCYEDLGCIEITDEWFDLLNRPLNLLPLEREKINTRFILYTRSNVANPREVRRNRSELIEGGYEGNKTIKFVVHGFIDTGFSSWVTKLCQQLTVVEDSNVFAVDWGGGSLPLYTQATANTRVVGLEIAHFINFLIEEFKADASDIHIIGHSLGAHVAGYTGEKVRGIGRITGLDPAEPYFQYMPEFVRLDPSDANFVDVIHSDGRTILLFGYGMRQPCGHVDFYPNDGREQPGCELTEIPLNLVHLHGYDEVQREIFACNHHRAIYYFIESLLSKCQYVGHVCDDYDSYLKGQCYSCGEDGKNCAVMGIDADKYRIGNNSLVPFYLSTGKTTPFCIHHYRVNLQLAFPQHAAAWVIGKLKMSITGTLNSIKNINISPKDNLRIDHGTNLTFLVQNSQELGEIENIRIDWKYNNNYLDLMSQCWMFICNNKLFVKKIEILDIDEAGLGKSDYLNVRICGEVGTKYTRISSGSHVIFDRRC